MAFFIVSKGHITAFNFAYLDGKIPVRMEPTRIHGQLKKGHPESVHERDYYAYELMNKNVITLSPAARIGEARALMQEKKIHHVPLVIDHKLTGLISAHDLTNLPETDNLKNVAAKMSRLVLCASDSSPLRHIVEVFFRENINALPLIDEEFRLTGIITHRDLLRWLLDNRKLLKTY